MQHLEIEITEEEVKREREKSRELRKSRWWKNRVALGHCHWCGKQFTAEELTMDHMIPISRGGRSEKFNLVPCCKACNTQKQRMLPTEWDDYMLRIGADKKNRPE